MSTPLTDEDLRRFRQTAADDMANDAIGGSGQSYPVAIVALCDEVERLRAEPQSTAVAWCPDCGEVETCDEDGCCSCGLDIVVFDGRGSYETALDHIGEARAEIQRLTVDLAEARAIIAAELGLPEGAPSKGWFPGPGGWHRNGNCGQDVALCVREDVTAPVDWNVWPDDAAVSEPMARGQADTYREAMKAADAALEANR